MKFLRDEMQEVGLKEGGFFESIVINICKEPQPPLKGMFGNSHFEYFAEVEENNEVQEESQAIENANFDEDFGLHDIPD